MKIYGNPHSAGIGGAGIEVPIEPPAVSPARIAARQAQQIAAIEAAETTATAVAASGRKPARRSAGREIRTLVSSDALPRQASSPPAAGPSAAPLSRSDVPSPRRDGALEERTIQQLTTDLATAAEQISTFQVQVSEQAACVSDARADLVAAHAQVQAATERAEAGALTIRALKTELEMAGRRITSLRAQASEQGTSLQDLCTELDQAHAELATVRAQVQATTARAETAEAALAGIRQRVQTALTGDLPTAPPAELEHEDQPEQDLVEPVMCEGGCGMPVDPVYVQRTKRRWHGGHCADLAVVADRSPGRRAVA